MDDRLRLKLTVQFFDDEKCFGPGVCRLLELVDEEKSLRKASQKMGMAYSKAWKIVKRAQEGLGFMLLESRIGGKEGGGAELTDKAKEFIKNYREMEKDINEYSSRCYEKYIKTI